MSDKRRGDKDGGIVRKELQGRGIDYKQQERDSSTEKETGNVKE